MITDKNSRSLERRLPFRVKFGYTMGQCTDSLSFNLFYFFFLIFLTDVIGIPAAKAGTVILIAVFWDAITDPVIGNISDNLTLSSGRRRPLMIGSLIPFALMTFLLYNNSNIVDHNYKAAYFTIVTILFWSAYKTFVIPFFALGGEMTDDFNERISLRVWASFGIYGSVILASSAPPTIVDLSVTYAGLSVAGGWIVVGSLFALSTLITGFICWRATRGREFIFHHQVETSKSIKKSAFISDISQTMRDIFKLSSARYLALSVFFWSSASAMTSSALIYLMDRNLEYSAGKISIIFLIGGCIAFVWLPIINYVTKRFDKRSAYYIGMGISAIIISLFYLIGFPYVWVLLLYFIFFELGNTFFWTIYYSMMYDINELDEFVSERRREGSIAAIMSFTQKTGSAIAIWMTGLILGLSGYDGLQALQPESARSAILALCTWIPGIIGIMAAIAAFMYPLTRRRFYALMTVLQAKRKGESYELTVDVERLLK